MIILIDASSVSVVFVDFMSLTSLLISRKIYNDAKLLIEELNKHAESESYAVVIARFKKFKKDVDWIIYIRCNREKKARLTNFERRIHSDTWLMKCSFSVVDKQNENDDWYLEVIWNESHNHTSTLVSAHSALRRLVMTEKIQESISSLIKFKIRSTQILTHLRLDANQENSFFTWHDVYNVKNQQRKQTFDILSSVQTFLQNLKHNCSDSDSTKRTSLIESSNSSSVNQAVVICWHATARYSSWTASTRSIVTKCHCWLSSKSLLWTSSSLLNSASWQLKKWTMCEFWSSWSFCILSFIDKIMRWKKSILADFCQLFLS